MSRYTFLDFAEDVLLMSSVPMAAQEIWDYGVKNGVTEKLTFSGLTPGSTLGARLFVDVRDNPNTKFIKVSKHPTRFFLKSRINEINYVAPSVHTRELSRSPKEGQSSKVLEEILQALSNLGGKAATNEILDEVERIRAYNFSESERGNYRSYLHIYYSKFRAPDGGPYYAKVGRGVWALNGNTYITEASKNNASNNSSAAAKARPQTIAIDDVQNSLRTIREYKDYYDPASDEWSNYIYEIFHVLGFNTEKINSRLFLLKSMGSSSRQALVIHSHPSENETWIAPEISWKSYLYFAASHYQVNWGIHTNGLRLEIFNFKRNRMDSVAVYQNFGKIVEDENIEAFFNVYKMFNLIDTSPIIDNNTSEKKSIVENDDGEISWKDQVYIALQNLGGEASLAELYEYIENNPLRKLSPTYQSTIRWILQQYCSETQQFGGKEDIFRQVDKGRWKIA